MDTGEGRFMTAENKEELRIAAIGRMKQFISEHPKADVPHVFQVGQEVEIHGSRFRIAAIGSKFMKLRLLPRAEF